MPRDAPTRKSLHQASEFSSLVCSLPGELFFLAAKVAVSGRGPENLAKEIQRADDAGGREIENLTYRPLKPSFIDFP